MLKKLHKNPADVRILQTEDWENVEIPRKSVEDAPRILGCYLATDGKWLVKYGRWKAEGARFAQKVMTVNFKRKCGENVYLSIWLAKLSYVSSVVCFDHKESNKINNQVLLQCIPASGYNRHFPRQVVYGPKRYGGMQWETCAPLQILLRVKFFLHHLRRGDKIGRLFQVVMVFVQLQAGITDSILNTNCALEKYVERTWLSYLKESLSIVYGGIITNFSTPTPQRRYDRALMEVFGSWNLKKKEMEAINRCRIYVQVMFVLDVADYLGQYIVEDAFSVRIVRKSCLKWSRQVCPPLGDRKVWRRYLRRLCFDSNKHITTIGIWTSPSHQVSKYMVTEDRCTSLLRFEDGIQRGMNRVGRNRFVKHGEICLEPVLGYPVTFQVTGSGYNTEDSSAVRPTVYNMGTRRPPCPRDKVYRKTLGRIFATALAS